METTAITWTLGDRLVKARRLARISTQGMADYLGVDRSTIRNYEADRTVPKAAVLRAWAGKCQVPFSWLANDNEAATEGDIPIIWSGENPVQDAA